MMEFFRTHTKKIMLAIVIVFVVSVFATYGINAVGGGSQETGGRDYAVAKINGEQVMRSRVDLELGRWLQANAFGQPVSEDVYPQIRSMILDDMAIQSEMQREVKARSITLTDDELNAAIRTVEHNFPTREIFLQTLQREGLDEKKFRAQVETQMREMKVIEQVVAPASTDETEKHAMYDTMKQFIYQKPEGFFFNLAHFRSEANAKSARDKIEAGGKWDDVMDEVSKDVITHTPYDSTVLIPTAEMTGTLEMLITAPMNKVSAPFMFVSDDYIIALKREKQDAGMFTYDEVSSDVESRVLAQKRQTLTAQFMQELRVRANVEILDKEIFAVSTPLTPADTEAASDAVDQIAAVSDDAASADKSADKADKTEAKSGDAKK